MKSDKLFLRLIAIFPVFLLILLSFAFQAFAQDIKTHGKPANLSPLGLKIVRNLDTCEASGCHDSVERNAIHGDQFLRQKCSACHTLASWKPSTFVHKDDLYGDFKLVGKHKGLTCGYCHRPKLGEKKVVYKPIKAKSCYSSGCHDSKIRGDVHGIQFRRRACGKCHTQENWKPTIFSHDNPGYRKFKLKGKHRDVPCEGCHKKSSLGFTKYRPLAKNSCGVGACHEKAHKGRRGQMDCALCHDENGWKEVVFDHNSRSAFKLKDAHSKLSCDACHVGERWRPLMSECVDCHEEIDPHKGKLGFRCEQCHESQTWKPLTFDHELTGYKLEGAHRQFACIDCHKEKGIYGGIGPECIRCHVDPHFNQFGTSCEDCHTAEQWAPRLFRHGDTAFQLDGVHRQIDCEDCHENRFYRGTPLDCVFCHSSDFQAPEAKEFHAHGFTSCETCHKTWGWTPARLFRHSIMTFSGSHKSLEQDCEYCHLPGQTPKFPGASSERDCAACHMSEYTSVHANNDPIALPPCPDNCEICHTTIDFANTIGALQCD